MQTQNQIIERNEIATAAPLMVINSHQPSSLQQPSLGALYPILNDYSGLELSIVAQNNSVAIPISQSRPIEITNGVRKVKTKNNM